MPLLLLFLFLQSGDLQFNPGEDAKGAVGEVDDNNDEEEVDDDKDGWTTTTRRTTIVVMRT